VRAIVAERERRLGELAAALDAMSPLKVLARGYAIATTSAGRAVRRAEDVGVGDPIDVRVAHGRLAACVTAVFPEGGGEGGTVETPGDGKERVQR